MKNLFLVFTLLFSTVMFSPPSYAKWTEMDENDRGNIFYVDYERIKKHGGLVYFLGLTDYLKSDK